MTTQFTGLYFPETIAQYPSFSQLLLFFDSLNQYLPSEDSLTPDALLVREGLLQQQTPLPFNDGLVSFQKLIKDIQGHGNAFYGSYLSSLSNSAAIDIDEASVWNLIGQMTPHDEKASREKEDALMQARLLLKLAEIHQHEAVEIDKQMDILRSKKESLLSTLKGEFSIDVISDMLPANETESPNRLRQRCKAWINLLLATNEPSGWLAVTHSPEIIDSFMETADDRADKEPLFEIPLTNLTSKDTELTDYLIKRHDFQTSTKTTRETLHKLLRTAADSSQERSNFLPDRETLTQWQSVVQNEPEGATATLQFFHFKMPLRQLFCQTYGMPDPTSENTRSKPNTIIALLNQTQSP